MLTRPATSRPRPDEAIKAKAKDLIDSQASQAKTKAIDIYVNEAFHEKVK
jgi:hypothetical protein